MARSGITAGPNGLYHLTESSTLRNLMGSSTFNTPVAYSGAFPKITSHLHGFDAGLFPPGLLVADPMQRAMMRAAKRDHEFITGFAAQRARLHKSEVMGIGRLPAA